MLNTSFSPWPSYTKEELKKISSVLNSNKVNYWTGQECRNFEKEFAIWSQSKYAVALANGTLALEAAMKSLEISKGDEVIVTSRSYIASVSSIINSGATPVFADVDLSSQNITPESILAVLTKKTKAIVCVHLAGWPCDMDKIYDIADKYKLFIIEDCAQAHGAKYKGKSVGSIGHIGCWSFCQDKIITTGGEGGMITTNSETLWRKIWSYKDNGKSYEAIYEREEFKNNVGFNWIHESFGSNWRLTEIQAAIGRIQIKRMEDWHKKRIRNAQLIWNVAKECKGLRAPNIPDHLVHAAYKCYVFIEGTSQLRDKIISQINEKGVPCYSGACPEVYLEKAFDNSNLRPKSRLHNAKKLGETSLMFLVHPTLTNEEIQKTCEVLKEAALFNF